MKKFTFLVILLAMGLVLAACASTEAPVTEPQAEAEAEQAESITEESAEAPAAEETMDEEAEQDEVGETIVDIAVADGRFNTLVEAVMVAGLTETLSGEGDFTVFAPTDDAFASLPEGTVESLLEDPEGVLIDVLLYHVVDGAIPAETVVTLDSAIMLNGEPVAISVDSEAVVLNDSVEVIITDIEASNGIIHVIDGVLLPASIVATGEGEMAEEAPSIADIAVEDGRFTTLVAALDAAGLVETLSGEGEFTVFAPTDDAFAALPEGTVDTLLADPSGALTDVLLYHVVDGAVPAETVMTLDSATTLNGEPVAISVVDGNVFLNEDAQVTTTDVEAANGIIHVIDAVILPPSMSEAAAADEESMDEAAMSIAEIAAGDEQFSTLVAALDAAGLVDALAGEGEFTVFAPPNTAFDALPEGTVDSLLQDPEGALTDILLYHVVDGAVPAETVVTLDAADTLQGEAVTIQVDGSDVLLNETVRVLTTDIQASNGIIHVVDSVLLPPSLSATASEEMMEESMSIAEIAAGDEQFSTLVAALDAAGLVDTFAGEGEFTVFAPTNEAFAKLEEGTVELLLEDPSGALTDILAYHVVEGAVRAEDVVTLDAAPTLLGEDITVSVSEEGEVFLNETVQVVVTDIEAANGVIHVIDGVLLPPATISSEAPAATTAVVKQMPAWTKHGHNDASCNQKTWRR